MDLGSDVVTAENKPL